MPFADFVVSWWEDYEPRQVQVCAECAEAFVPWAVVQEADDNGVTDYNGYEVRCSFGDFEACQFCVGE